ncbi:uncharacterized protein F4807DRAFT_438476 [Annulohypoxylon truncatum]|uniref:uncharacterized protein n=1 Tax=Annulohypoxylon truncatum TaxID=327061 RepID=UPI0020074C07|nr:uncharacterized protein F4807DRAFT_438476 [Annulohypoxylon truncatum]KAI1206575.1 hypothetical protein F4807DRAFT_438476 [Annulohypoxylon truncatum]
MPPATSMVTLGGHRALFYTPPRGTHSRIISLHLHRHSRVPTTNFSSCRSLYASHAHSIANISSQDFDWFCHLLGSNANKTPGIAASSVAESSDSDPVSHVTGPLRRVLLALQHGDPLRMFINIRLILEIKPLELQEAIAALPRTTFTQILKGLDPSRISWAIDPTDKFNITAGMAKVLGMESYIDDWGIRSVYVKLLECIKSLVLALQATGQTLQTEEYTYLFRYAGFASDIEAARWFWTDMIKFNTKSWRAKETYDEYMSARFLTKDPYNGYDKTRKVNDPRNLHRSRFRLSRHKIIKLDILRFHVRKRKMYFGLNKSIGHAEDLIRSVRKSGPVARVFSHYLLQKRGLTPNLLYTAIIAYARVGALRFIGTMILRRYFGICLGRLIYKDDLLGPHDQITSCPSIYRPSLKLMKTIVDAYCMNGEIALACQLVDHISKTQNIPVPMSIWYELLNWTHVLSSPPLTTAWKIADIYWKIPGPSAVETMFNFMVERGVQPRFKEYWALIQSLIARHHFSKVVPLMREAVRLNDTICEEYEEAVLEYAQLVRDGVRVSEAIMRYERLRFLKARTWYDLQTICRQFLLKVRSHSLTNPLVTVAVPNFIREFRTFIPNPAHYRTSTGYVELFDPIRDVPQKIRTYRLPMDTPQKHNRRWFLRRTVVLRTELVHGHSLAGHLPMAKLGLDTLLLNTSRWRRPSKGHVPPDKPAAPYDDDEFY